MLSLSILLFAMLQPWKPPAVSEGAKLVFERAEKFGLVGETSDGFLAIIDPVAMRYNGPPIGNISMALKEFNDQRRYDYELRSLEEYYKRKPEERRRPMMTIEEMGRIAACEKVKTLSGGLFRVPHPTIPKGILLNIFNAKNEMASKHCK